ncbi:MAG: ATP-dependent helicase, partial [Lentisphaerota bacterium]
MYYYHEPPLTEEIQNKINNFNALTQRLENSFSKNSKVDLPEGLRIDYENKLNAKQLEAVAHINGPLLVIAGAGTGKTQTLVYRVSYLLENGIAPQNILLLTFTKNAAKQMLDKAKKIIGDKYNLNLIAGGTFHSFANMIIRQNPTVFDISRNFTILDVPDSEDTIELVRKSIDASAIGKELPDKKLLQKIISVSKSSLIAISEAVDREAPKSEFKWYFNKTYELYEDYKLKHEQLDFDDLLLVLLKKLKENKDFKEQLQEQFKYILVDEFQDTNIVQGEIVNELGDKYSNIMAVGDDSQSIYYFRGANVENILLFPEKYPECKLIKLEENYRSQSNILNLANEITNQFKIGYRKKLFSSLYRDWLPKVVLTYNDKIQAHIIIEMLNDIKGIERENYK